MGADGRYVPVGDESARLPAPPVPAGNGKADMSPPPGNFKDKDELSAPPGNFVELKPPPGQFGEAPSGSTPQAHINHGVSQLPSNHAEEEERRNHILPSPHLA